MVLLDVTTEYQVIPHGLRYPKSSLITLADPNKQAFCNVLKFTLMSNFLIQCSKFLLTVPNVQWWFEWWLFLDFAKFSSIPYLNLGIFQHFLFPCLLLLCQFLSLKSNDPNVQSIFIGCRLKFFWGKFYSDHVRSLLKDLCRPYFF